jgi:hypothetical protein
LKTLKPHTSKQITSSIIKGLKESLAFTNGKKVKSLQAIPRFKSEDEERKFWYKHDTTGYMDWPKAKKVSFPNL